MSQPPSLPKLTAFLRPGQQQQPPQQQQSNPERTEKRRLDHGGPPRAAPLYAHDDSELHRQKRRANLFVQYGEADYRTQQHQPPQRQPQHQHPLQQQQGSAAFDRQHSFPSPNAHPVSPYGTRARVAPPNLALVDHHQRHPVQAPFREYTAGRHGTNSGRTQPSPRDTVPPVMTDARRAIPVKTEPPQSSGSATATQEPIQRERKSRYLSESDRRSIIARIDQGEKQVALAKEYQVSRAAICNLYKNRKDVLTRADRESLPKAKPTAKRGKHVGGGEEKHEPGESRGASTVESGVEEKDTSDGQPVDEDAMSDENSSTESVDTEPPTTSSRSPTGAPGSSARHVGTPPASTLRVHNASSSSYPIRRFVSVLRDAQLPQATLRRITKRLISCLMEEVVVCLPRRERNVVTSAGDAFAGTEPIQDDQICAISMEEQGTLMLQTLLDVFPSAMTALVSTSRRESAFGDQWPVTCNRLPKLQGTSTSVVLLASACATGARVATVIDYLVSVGHISPTNIFVATVISSRQGIARLNQQFPGVTIVSATIDDGLDEQGRIRPGLGDLMDRFWHETER